VKKIKKFARKNIIQPEFDREVHRILNMVYKTGISYKDISIKTGIGLCTLKNWRKSPKDGGTRYPAGWRLDAVAEACGYRKVWVTSDTQDLTKAIPFEEDPEPTFKVKKPKRNKSKSKSNVVEFQPLNRKKDASSA